MGKQICLDEISVSPDTSKEKRRFLELCAARICEAVRIFVETHPDFDYKLAEGRNPHEVGISGSRHYDAEVSACGWCYIYSISTNDKSKSRVQVNIVDREELVFTYKNQKFAIHYGKIPQRSKSRK